jgi:hypothetical protein
MITVCKSDFDRRIVPDDCPDTSYLEQAGFENRLRQYRQGDFDYVGVRAAVELPIPFGKDRILVKVESPGLWGIESDSGEDYFDSVFQEESAILADMLAELGVKVAEL